MNQFDPNAPTQHYAGPTKLYPGPTQHAGPPHEPAGAGRMPAPEYVQERPPEAALEQEAAFVPFYVVVDESYSMANEIPTLNAGLGTIRDALKHQPQMRELAQLSIISFSDSAVRRMEMRPMSAEMDLPLFQARQSTAFSAAFDFLTQCIPADIESIKNQEAQQGRPRPPVVRPIVFFLSDGNPNAGDPWKAARERLNSIYYAPVVVAFGYGSVTPSTLVEIATAKAAFVARDNVSPEVVITEFFNVIMGTVLRSKAVALNGNAQGVALEQPAGDFFLPAARLGDS